jgi:hypothetical protein
MLKGELKRGGASLTNYVPLSFEGEILKGGLEGRSPSKTYASLSLMKGGG